MRAELPHIAADILMRLRARAPRVHCITNAVAQTFTANTLLAAGAVPSMTLAADEIGAFVARADALLVNLGTFDAERRAATAAALGSRPNGAFPGCSTRCSSIAPRRARTMRSRWSRRTRTRCGSTARSLRRCREASRMTRRSRRYALDTRAVMALTGTVDRITDGAQQTRIENGHPLMARVTAMGCAASALTAAFLAVESDAFKATASALLCFGVAGGLAGERASGPGSFPAALLDALYALDKHTLEEKARVT